MKIVTVTTWDTDDPLAAVAEADEHAEGTDGVSFVPTSPDQTVTDLLEHLGYTVEVNGRCDVVVTVVSLDGTPVWAFEESDSLLADYLQYEGGS